MRIKHLYQASSGPAAARLHGRQRPGQRRGQYGDHQLRPTHLQRRNRERFGHRDRRPRPLATERLHHRCQRRLYRAGHPGSDQLGADHLYGQRSGELHRRPERLRLHQCRRPVGQRRHHRHHRRYGNNRDQHHHLPDCPGQRRERQRQLRSTASALTTPSSLPSTATPTPARSPVPPTTATRPSASSSTRPFPPPTSRRPGSRSASRRPSTFGPAGHRPDRGHQHHGHGPGRRQHQRRHRCHRHQQQRQLLDHAVAEREHDQVRAQPHHRHVQSGRRQRHHLHHQYQYPRVLQLRGDRQARRHPGVRHRGEQRRRRRRPHRLRYLRPDSGSLRHLQDRRLRRQRRFLHRPRQLHRHFHGRQRWVPTRRASSRAAIPT